MTVTEKELEERRARIAKLNEQIASAESTRVERVNEQEREIEAAQLDAEIVRLEAQLSAAKEQAKVGEVKTGAAGPLAQAKELLASAEAQAEAPVGPVDTNPEKSSGPSNTNGE